MTPPREHPHQEIINGLLQLAGYLTDNPGLPSPSDVSVSWHMGGENSQRVAGVREIARQLDVDMVWDESGTQAWALWQFPGVAFVAVGQLVPEPDAQPPTQELAPLYGEQAVPEVDCPRCLGTGRENAAQDEGTCGWCLGKGRVADMAAPAKGPHW